VQKQELGETGGGDGPGQHGPRLSRERHRHDQGRDEEDVEQNRRGGGGGETVERVQDAAQQRHQGHEQEIGKGDAAEFDGQLELGGIGREPGRQDMDHPRHARHRGGGQRQQARKQNRQRLFGEGLGGDLATLFQTPREERHEGRVERPLGEQPAKQIGQPEGHEEGIGDRPGADHRGDQDVPHESENPAESGVAADRGDGTKEGHRVITSGRGCP
jgi:hypothetical protein